MSNKISDAWISSCTERISICPNFTAIHSAWKSGPVRFFIQIWEDRDRDRSSLARNPQNRDRNRHRPVHSGFCGFSTVARPVGTGYGSDQFMTGLGPVLKVVIDKIITFNYLFYMRCG